jgi:hypothetical protein
VPAQQGRSRFGAEQRRELLVRRGLGVTRRQLVFLPFDAVVFGERRARIRSLAGGGRVLLGRLARIGGVSFHRPPADLRARPDHGPAAAARLHQALEPQHRHRVPDHDLRYAVGAAQLLHGGQAFARRVPARQDLLA